MGKSGVEFYESMSWFTSRRVGAETQLGRFLRVMLGVRFKDVLREAIECAKHSAVECSSKLVADIQRSLPWMKMTK